MTPYLSTAKARDKDKAVAYGKNPQDSRRF
jgi:hypothetical protein